MAKVKTAVKAEVGRFAKERDAQFERTRERASMRFKQKFSIDSILESPEKYLKLFFTIEGLRVVRAMVDDAKKIGKQHAERLQQTNHSDA